jgi:hypothetical protein
MLESVVLAVRRDDGTIFLSVRNLCVSYPSLKGLGLYPGATS